METLKPIVTEKLNLILFHKICSQLLFKGTTFYNRLIGCMQYSRYRDLLIIICVTSEPCYNFFLISLSNRNYSILLFFHNLISLLIIIIN